MTDTLLVSTYRSLLRVEPRSRSSLVMHTGLGLYYGITWDQSGITVAARWYPWYMPTSHIERPVRIRFNRDLTLRDVASLPAAAGGVHQISRIGDQTFYACSREDAYLVESEGEYAVWRPSPDPSHHGRDTHHFNSIWSDEDHLFLVGHNRGPSDVWVFERHSRRFVKKLRMGEWAHNVWRLDGQLSVCNSRLGRIETQSGEVLAETGGFPRGVAVTDDRIYVGVSGRAHRMMRWVGRSDLLVFDRSWNLLDSIDLGHNGGVNEIRVLNKPDLAHNVEPFWPTRDDEG